jgi:hypothetical protein
MYLLDPVRGKRRRALWRDQLVHAVNQIEVYGGKTLRDLNNRINGLLAESQSLFFPDYASDRVIRERVRSKLGRYVSHPAAIEVEVSNGHVTLRGPVLASEVKDLLVAMLAVRGAIDVHNELEEHEQPGDIPALQGGTRRRGQQLELMQSNWSPAVRLFGGVLGTMLMGNCVARRTPAAVLLGTFGFGLFVRAVTNLQPARFLERPWRMTHPAPRARHETATARY